MAPTRNARTIFNTVPTGYPIPGVTTVYDAAPTIDIDTVPLGDGSFVLKTLVLSIDPSFRVRMGSPDMKSAVVPFALGEPLVSHGIGIVVRSAHPKINVGDHIYGFLAHQEYNVFDLKENLDPANAGLRIIENEHGLPWSVYVGAAGMPGKTAYMAWKEYSQARKGEIVFVSTGAGAVGSLVIQFAKRDGLKVIASAGSEQKVAFMKSIGADVAFNYKITSTAEVLEREGPIDVYWDNVGGETLDAALVAAKPGARFLECGMSSGYNTGGQPVKNLMLLVRKSLSIYGFAIAHLEPKHDAEFYATVPRLLASGELKYAEEITVGLEKVGEAILQVQRGENSAKSVVRVAEE